MRCYYIRLRWLPWALALALAVACLLSLRYWAGKKSADVLSPLLFQRTVIVDAGHGGIDSGVVGRNGTLEKDIDLQIAQKLSELLRAGGASVTMTREQDFMLGHSKAGDLAARVQLADELAPAAFISIHGNSFPSMPAVHGAQVFYFGANEQGKLLANAVQHTLVENLGNSDRVALTHKTAYILKHITAPAIVVEVGFLSNAEEEQLLSGDDYQWQVAWAIYDGLLDYLATASAAGPQLEIVEEQGWGRPAL